MRSLFNHKALMVYVFMVAMMTLVVYTIQDNAIDRERDAQIAACVRVQILRDQSNAINLLAYDTWMESVKRERALTKTDRGGAAEHRRSADKLLRTARRMVVTGPTDCVASVDHPSEYSAPSPEFIYKSGPRVREVRRRAQQIVVKAEKGLPLYGPIKP